MRLDTAPLFLRLQRPQTAVLQVSRSRTLFLPRGNVNAVGLSTGRRAQLQLTRIPTGMARRLLASIGRL